MFHKQLMGQAEILANAANLVFEEIAQRLDEGKGHFFGQTTDVVMRFDGSGRTLDGDGFDDVGIQSALHEMGKFAVRFPFLEFHGLLGEYGNKFRPNELALALGVGNAVELSEKASGGIDADNAKTETLAQHFESFLEFIFA